MTVTVPSKTYSASNIRYALDTAADSKTKTDKTK